MAINVDWLIYVGNEFPTAELIEGFYVAKSWLKSWVNFNGRGGIAPEGNTLLPFLTRGAVEAFTELQVPGNWLHSHAPAIS